MKRFLGYGAEELEGKSVFDFMHPDDVQHAVNVFAIGVGIPGHSEYIEVRFRYKNGSWRVFGGVGRNLLHDPSVRGIILNSRDVTERKRAEEELKRLNRELGAYAGVASHDPRVPLTIIASAGATLERMVDGGFDGISLERVAEVVEIVNRSTRRAQRLIDDLLALARGRPEARKGLAGGGIQGRQGDNHGERGAGEVCGSRVLHR